ncbi:serine protease 3 [Bombyx mori]|uniref:Peptidase S1 domain-containing protein n=1 Tax=Bombyx mori TaxID=7091 RepID=A0A8R1WJ51_BOMMO|nr:serine protease 3 [Bombyx mori]
MAIWTVVIFLVAFVGGQALADDTDFTFPEIARERSLPGSRIVSGWEASEGQFPYQLSIRMVSTVGGVNACGATIIHSNWGLTAAHCTGLRVTIIVRAGAVNLTRPGLLFETTKYINHPEYSENLNVVQPHDIGLIDFGRKLEFNDYIQPIRLQRSADKDRNYDNVRLVASGWGRTWTGSASPENLNWVFLNGISNLRCMVAYNFSPTIQPSTICTLGYNDTTQSTCQGDSGGPLTVIDEDGQITQVGVTSFVSSEGCHVDIPAGFIRPGHYLDWFKTVTGLDFDWTSSTTQAPETTETPGATEAPVTTEAPEATEAPVTTEAPGATEAPNTTEAPDATEAPVTTEAPEITEAPYTTETPETPETRYRNFGTAF